MHCLLLQALHERLLLLTLEHGECELHVELACPQEAQQRGVHVIVDDQRRWQLQVGVVDALPEGCQRLDVLLQAVRRSSSAQMHDYAIAEGCRKQAAQQIDARPAVARAACCWGFLMPSIA